MKTSILLIFGGQSSEHEISKISAGTYLKALNPEKHEIHPVFISQKGLWRYVPELLAKAPGGLPKEISGEEAVGSCPEAALLPGEDTPTLVIFEEKGIVRYPIDVAIPVLHGKNGEDGTIQGLFEMARVPYVGSGTLASAAAMDKITTKRLVKELGIRQAEYVDAYAFELKNIDKVVDRVEEKLSYPVFVKPSEAGSSVGVTQAKDREALKAALEIAAREDSRILIEESIVGREIECGVLGNDEPIASGVGEILAADSFYTYDAKYNNAASKTVVNPELPKETVEEIRRDAVRIFKQIGGAGLSRVDFFVEDGTGEVVFNEINTLPGFTPISMYPMLFGAAGYDHEKLVEALIGFALERAHGQETAHGPETARG